MTYDHAVRLARAMRPAADSLFSRMKTMNLDEAKIALETWRRTVLQDLATRMLQDGVSVLTSPEREAMGPLHSEEGSKEDPGLSLDLLMRASMPIARDQVRTEIARAIAGDRQSRAALAEWTLAGLRILGIPTDRDTPEAVRMVPLILRTLDELFASLEPIAAGDHNALEDALHWSLHQAPPPAAQTRPLDANPPVAAGSRDRERTQPDAPLRETASVSMAGRDEAATLLPLDAKSALVETAVLPEHVPLAQASSTAALLSEIWSIFVETKIVILKDWAPSRRPELAGTLRLLSWICGDRRIDSYTRADIAEFRSAYLMLPFEYHRQDRTAVSARDMIQAHKKENPEYRRVSAKTFNKHISTIGAFFEWARSEGKIDKSHVPGLDGLHVPLKQKNRGRSDRLMYEVDEIRRLFESPVWTGRKSMFFLGKPGDVVVRDSLYWVPLMCAYHGLRREEATQLRVRHVANLDEISYFNLNAPDLRLKVADAGEDDGSRRIVPLHRDFLKLGFLEDKVEGRNSDELLFEELSDDNAHGAFGVSVGKRFRHYQKSLKLVATDKEGGLHRLRHSFITLLQNTEAKTGFVAALTGHSSAERPTELDRYTKLIFLRNLKNTIDLLVLPINCEALLEAVYRSSQNTDRK